MFLDSEPEEGFQLPRSGMLLKEKKRTSTLLSATENETVFEFLAVGNRRIAVLLYIVKGGVNSQISSFFSFFLA